MAQDNSQTTLEMGTSDQVLATPKKKSKMPYIIGGVVLVVIIAVVITLAVVLSGNEGSGEDETTTNDPITGGPTGPTTDTPDTTAPTISVPDNPVTIDLEDIINGKYVPLTFSATWVSGDSVMMKNADDDLVKMDVVDNTSEILISNSSEAAELYRRSSRFLEMSPDESHVAFAYDSVPVYRHSFIAQYAVVDSSGQHQLITPPPTSTPGKNDAVQGLQNFVWGPQGSIAFVHKNDIYYKPSLSAETQQITTNGEEGIRYNGIPDWVYEEEVFSSNIAMWFSRDGSRLAYATFDDTDVRIMKVPHYGIPGNVLYQYTAHSSIRYPKPGTTNPTVTVTLRELNSGTANTHTAPANLNQPILLSVTFVSNDNIAVVWTNRVQNEMVVFLCGETCTQIFRHEEPSGWIDNNPLLFSEDGSSFVTTLPQTVNGVRYKQVVQVTRPQQGNDWTIRSRSNTAHTVLEIYGRSSNDVVWYKATAVGDSYQQHVYSVDSSDNVNCFTCSIRADAQDCLYNEASFSSDKSVVAINCAGPGIPQVFIYNINGELVRDWELNEGLREIFDNGGLPRIIHQTIRISDDIPEAEVQIQVPHDYATRTDVPLLVYVYGGPDTALVTRQWVLDWGTSLVTRLGIAVATIDGRGSGLKGVDNMFALNRRLGTVEIEDQIQVTKHLQDNFNWIDSNRTCIWGWSYGGYAASLALAQGGDVFKCAIAVAPVTDWAFYDTIYTERYMDTPQNNLEAYTRSSLLSPNVVEQFRNKNYFLIHGTADDNVHYQHSMVLSRRLQLANILFKQMSYTDEDHGLVGVRPHLYRNMEKFLKENLIE